MARKGRQKEAAKRALSENKPAPARSYRTPPRAGEWQTVSKRSWVRSNDPEAKKTSEQLEDDIKHYNTLLESYLQKMDKVAIRADELKIDKPKIENVSRTIGDTIEDFEYDINDDDYDEYFEDELDEFDDEWLDLRDDIPPAREKPAKPVEHHSINRERIVEAEKLQRAQARIKQLEEAMRSQERKMQATIDELGADRDELHYKLEKIAHLLNFNFDDVPANTDDETELVLSRTLATWREAASLLRHH